MGRPTGEGQSRLQQAPNASDLCLCAATSSCLGELQTGQKLLTHPLSTPPLAQAGPAPAVRKRRRQPLPVHQLRLRPGRDVPVYRELHHSGRRDGVQRCGARHSRPQAWVAPRSQSHLAHAGSCHCRTRCRKQTLTEEHTPLVTCCSLLLFPAQPGPDFSSGKVLHSLVPAM